LYFVTVGQASPVFGIHKAMPIITASISKESNKTGGLTATCDEAGVEAEKYESLARERLFGIYTLRAQTAHKTKIETLAAPCFLFCAAWLDATAR
jgi:hypothetical protein